MGQGRHHSYKANEICSTFDISKATLFRWERDGLITDVGRDWRNWRLYTDKHLRAIERLIARPGERRVKQVRRKRLTIKKRQSTRR